MLWNLLVAASNEVHSSMEPMYSSIDPNLPTFRCERIVNNDRKDHFVKNDDGEYVTVDEDCKQQLENSWMSSIKGKMMALMNTQSNNSAKNFLKDLAILLIIAI